MYTFKFTSLQGGNKQELVVIDLDDRDEAVEAATRTAADIWDCSEDEVLLEGGLPGEYFDIEDFDAAADECGYDDGYEETGFEPWNAYAYSDDVEYDSDEWN